MFIRVAQPGTTPEKGASEWVSNLAMAPGANHHGHRLSKGKRSDLLGACPLIERHLYNLCNLGNRALESLVSIAARGSLVLLQLIARCRFISALKANSSVVLFSNSASAMARSFLPALRCLMQQKAMTAIPTTSTPATEQKMATLALLDSALQRCAAICELET